MTLVFSYEYALMLLDIVVIFVSLMSFQDRKYGIIALIVTALVSLPNIDLITSNTILLPLTIGATLINLLCIIIAPSRK